MPQLTEFTFSEVYFELESNTIDLFEYCGALEVIALRLVHMSPESSEAVFESIAAHCCNLHTFVVSAFTAYGMPGFWAVPEHCPTLNSACGLPSQGDTTA